ncbi:ABC transporter permease [Nocardioides salsibiostraticola]
MSSATTTPSDAEPVEPPRQVRIVDAPLVEPSAYGLKAVFQKRYLLRLLVRREVNARYSGSFLGLLWSYLNPLSQLFIFWFVMGVVIGRGTVPNFALHVFSGLVVVYFFTETFNAGTRSIVSNKGLVKKMAVPREMFPVASMLVSLYHVGPQMIILVISCVIAGWSPDLMGMVAVVLALSISMTLGLALALMFSVANVFFRDFGSTVSIMTNFVRFSVPMIYPYTLVAERFRGHVDLFLANPIANAVLLMQRAFWQRTTVDGQGNPAYRVADQEPDFLFIRGLIVLGVCILLLGFAQWVFSRFENKIPERL